MKKKSVEHLSYGLDHNGCGLRAWRGWTGLVQMLTGLSEVKAAVPAIHLVLRVNLKAIDEAIVGDHMNIL